MGTGSIDAIPQWRPQDPGDHDVGACALVKLHALAAALEAAEEPGGQDPVPPSSHHRALVSAPRVQPSGKEDIPVKTV
jgi:hypothetical protein